MLNQHDSFVEIKTEENASKQMKNMYSV
uniref:Uncharacterized protein n=1 Tax=Anguilla anguilla TaxID=7936 RepID=A0A0E9VHE3_ANGAN